MDVTRRPPHFAVHQVPPNTLLTVFLNEAGFEIGWPQSIVNAAVTEKRMREVVQAIAERLLTSFDEAVEIQRNLRSAGKN